MNDLRNIDPYTAWQPFVPSAEIPWTDRLAAHLFRRAGFGASFAELEEAANNSPDQIVSEMIAKSRQEQEFRDVADTLAETVIASGNARSLSAAWVYRLLRTPNPLQEKMTLFWHGHFATSAEKVKDPRMMWEQNQLLRKNALGNFGSLVQAISKNPAMLVYLDSTSNRKAHPNENYAREVMELFCLGEGHYTEVDVQELARCFTGWEIKNHRFRKNRYQHDGSEKSILGKTGEFGGEEGVAIVIQQEATPQFICRKLVRFFVCDEPELSDEFIAPLVRTMQDNDLEIAPVVSQILTSQFFYSKHAVGRKIKSPVEFMIGTMRCLEASGNTQQIAEGLMQAGQGLFYPPSVKGWDGGRTWINSSTLLARANLAQRILNDAVTKFHGENLGDYLQTYDIDAPMQLIPWFNRLTMTAPLDPIIEKQIIDRIPANEARDEKSLRGIVEVIATLPAYHLA